MSAHSSISEDLEFGDDHNSDASDSKPNSEIQNPEPILSETKQNEIILNDNEDESSSEDEPDELFIGLAASDYQHQKVLRGKTSPIDMSPPDAKLKQCQRRIRRYGDHNKPNKLFRELYRNTALSRIVYGSNHWRYMKAYATLAEHFYSIKGPAFAVQSEEYAKRAKQMISHMKIEANDPFEKSEIWQCMYSVYFVLGCALTHLNSLNDADDAFTRAEQLFDEWKAMPAPPDEALMDTEISLRVAHAKLLCKREQLAPSAQEFALALDVAKRRHGSQSILLIPILHGLGKVEQSKGAMASHELALRHFQDAYEIARVFYRGAGPELADAQVALAQALTRVGDKKSEESAENHLREAIALFREASHEPHAKLLDAADDLARLLIRTGRPLDGAHQLKSSMPAKTAVFGECSERVANAHKLLATVLLAAGCRDEAKHHLSECLLIEEILYDKNHKNYKNIKETRETMAFLKANSSRTDDQQRFGVKQ